MKNKIFYIDLFSGAGGTTTGVHLAGSEVVACVNHDPKAIESHKTNHPKCHHFIEDIRDFKVVEGLKKIVSNLRQQWPDCILIIWASLECTNYSNAKGGMPRDADSRTLANHLFMYLEHLQPEYLMIENVREFMAWGPLDEKGKPISRLKGKDYLKWVDTVKSFGLKYDWRLLNAANYGSFQSRVRYFGQFAKHGFPISWPAPTHSKTPEKQGGMFEEKLKRWKAVREVLDLNDVGESIFLRKKPLVESTLKRIHAGLLKFVAGGETDFLMKNYSGHPESKVSKLDKPSGTITTVDHHSLVQTKMLTSYYGNGGAHDVEAPCPTVTTKDRFSVVTPQFLDNQYGTGYPTSVDCPNGALTTNPKQQLVTVETTPTASVFTKHHYLMNPQYNDKGRNIDRPCFTLIARMDKMPPYLIEADQAQQTEVEIRKEDSPMTRKIKEFMIAYGIVDIKMRMLKIPELLRIQGFPEDYTLVGTQADQKKFIGNAVDVNVSRALALANREALAEFVGCVA